jgi:TolA-binding protein
MLRSLAITAALSLSAPAWALTCEEIMSMVDVNVPTNVVVSAMEGSGTRFSTTEIKCLVDRGAPAEVVQTARKMSGAAAPAEDDPPPDRTPPEDDGPDRFTPPTDAGPEDGAAEDTSGSSCRTLEDAIKLYKAKKLLTSSKSIYDMLEAKECPEEESRASYYLAKSLYDLQMFHGAQHYFMQVVKKGPKNPYFKYALPKLVTIAAMTGDDTEILRFVDKIPPESYPRQAKNNLYYLMGRKLYQEGKLSDAAKYFQQVSAKSDLYLKAKYYEGVIHNERGKLKSAVKSFREVYQSDIAADDDRQRKEMEDLKDLALMNIARIYFAIDRFDNADNFYSNVGRDSTYWAESLFERAYTQFWENDLNGSLGLLLTIRSPYYADEEFVPEAEILRSLAFYNLCGFKETERILVDFEKQYTPMRDEMSTFLEKYDSEEGRKLADQAFDQYFTEPHKGSKLTKSLFLRVLRNRDLADLVRHMDMMDEEEALIDAQKDAWKTGLGTHMKEVMADDRIKLKRRAGVVLIDELRQERDNIDGLNTQAEIIRFEVVDAERADAIRKSSQQDVDTQAGQRIDFATSTKVVYWPFNGEFWRDELGYYRYTEESQCNAR